MNIKKIFVIVISLYMAFIFNSCSSVDSDEPVGTCHFSNVEVAVPIEFTGMGNTTMFFTSDEHEEIFLIIGQTTDVEEDVAKNLALFESTRFFKNKIRFNFDEQSKEDKFSGSLYNERLEEEYHFEGYVIQNPEFYIFCMCKFESDNNYIKELVDDVYSSIDVLDE